MAAGDAFFVYVAPAAGQNVSFQPVSGTTFLITWAVTSNYVKIQLTDGTNVVDIIGSSVSTRTERIFISNSCYPVFVYTATTGSGSGYIGGVQIK